MSGDFPEDEEKTKPQTVSIRASDLVRNWAACPPEIQRQLEQLAAEHAEYARRKHR